MIQELGSIHEVVEFLATAANNPFAAQAEYEAASAMRFLKRSVRESAEARIELARFVSAHERLNKRLESLCLSGSVGVGCEIGTLLLNLNLTPDWAVRVARGWGATTHTELRLLSILSLNRINPSESDILLGENFCGFLEENSDLVHAFRVIKQTVLRPDPAWWRPLWFDVHVPSAAERVPGALLVSHPGNRQVRLTEEGLGSLQELPFAERRIDVASIADEPDVLARLQEDVGLVAALARHLLASSNIVSCGSDEISVSNLADLGSILCSGSPSASAIAAKGLINADPAAAVLVARANLRDLFPRAIGVLLSSTGMQAAQSFSAGREEWPDKWWVSHLEQLGADAAQLATYRAYAEMVAKQWKGGAE